MRRIQVMPRCTPACAACDACRADAPPATLEETLPSLEAEEIVLGGQIDGGVVFQTLPIEVRDALHERQLPLVLLGDNSDPTVSQVVVDDFAGAYAATKHLIGLGHKRILLFVHQSVKPHCSVEERQAGYRAAMAEAGLVVQECMRVAEEDAVDVLLRGQDRPTAVICSTSWRSRATSNCCRRSSTRSSS